MNFPKFWAKGEADGFEGWGWSDVSADGAKARGVETARRVAARFERGELNVPAARYGYADRPLREEVLREFRDDAGTVSGVITRNSYGCLVLNTAKLMFVDVDFAPPPAVDGGFSAVCSAPRKRRLPRTKPRKSLRWNARKTGCNAIPAGAGAFTRRARDCA